MATNLELIKTGLANGTLFRLSQYAGPINFAPASWAGESLPGAAPDYGDEGLVRIARPPYINRAHWLHPTQYRFHKRIVPDVFTSASWQFGERARPATHAELVNAAGIRAVVFYNRALMPVHPALIAVIAARRYGVQPEDVARNIGARDPAMFAKIREVAATLRGH
jgi:hypothetical protein